MIWRAALVQGTEGESGDGVRRSLYWGTWAAQLVRPVASAQVLIS